MIVIFISLVSIWTRSELPSYFFLIPIISSDCLQRSCREINIVTLAFRACPLWTLIDNLDINSLNFVSWSNITFCSSHSQTAATDTILSARIIPVVFIHSSIVPEPAIIKFRGLEFTHVLASRIHLHFHNAIQQFRPNQMNHYMAEPLNSHDLISYYGYDE